MKQSGLLIKVPGPEDYIAGGETTIGAEVRIQDGNWTPYIPSTEAQFAPGFDTMSCVTFSATNVLEMQVNWLIRNGKMSQKAIDGLKALGFFDANGNFNISDRYTAIMSGTTKNGNYFQKVAESLRKDGILPEKDFPFEGSTFEEYHDASKITAAMKAKAQKAYEFLTLAYDWVFFDDVPELSEDQFNKATEALKTVPVQIGIQTPATHAISMVSLYKQNNNPYYKVFDHYPNYSFEGDGYRPHFGMRIFLTEKVAPIVVPKTYPEYVFNRDLTLGMRHADVKVLQQVLIVEGLMKAGLDTGYFGPITQQAVRSFQARYGIQTVGRVGPQTRAKLNALCQKKNSVEPSSKLDRWALAIQKHEGYFAPGQNSKYPKGTLSWQNKNPGNIRYAGLFAQMAIGKHPLNFCIFETYEKGFEALKLLLTRAATGKSSVYDPEGDLYDFYSHYAPSADNNNPRAYAEAVAREIGVPATTKIKELV